MQTSDQIRHSRFLLLLEEAGSVKAMADRLGVSSAQISQIKNRSLHSVTGKPRSIGDEQARRMESAFGKPTGWMDAPVSLSADQQVGSFSPSTDAGAERPKQVRWHPVIAWETPSDLPDNEFALVSRRAVKLAAGDGKMVFEDEELPPLPFRADWLRGRRVTKHSNLVIVYAEGDSMEPDIRDGDAVLLDMGQRDVVDGQVYAIDYGGHLRVKRLQKRWDGGLIILSDNGEKYPPESLSADDAGHITVLGRVIWRGGSL